uniref:Uncharacterized protein n=1 Tax=Chromera velia CCMP2878 TaxID=1169474 RepID=A0A0G4FPY9_9ALVE|eukprot:Cvel_18183.t1-p1 / transcript=Cvel_18183.t1 / gene=Cvel_18183 / organism=Chromera_velia_CCMP2878 / gene_product=hypothetical protein / transcript_product=hypothetical protein / location=Cvel_scaffold1491:36350-36724(-) / protein_length=125 / sequence_SO=supercontig / SO=protein_coding / is_pseudo=false
MIKKLTMLVFEESAKSGEKGKERKLTEEQVRKAGVQMLKLAEKAESAVTEKVPSTEEIQKNGVAVIDVGGMDMSLEMVEANTEAAFAAAEKHTGQTNSTISSFLSLTGRRQENSNFELNSSLNLL